METVRPKIEVRQFDQQGLNLAGNTSNKNNLKEIRSKKYKYIIKGNREITKEVWYSLIQLQTGKYKREFKLGEFSWFKEQKNDQGNGQRSFWIVRKYDQGGKKVWL